MINLLREFIKRIRVKTDAEHAQSKYKLINKYDLNKLKSHICSVYFSNRIQEYLYTLLDNFKRSRKYRTGWYPEISICVDRSISDKVYQISFIYRFNIYGYVSGAHSYRFEVCVTDDNELQINPYITNNLTYCTTTIDERNAVVLHYHNCTVSDEMKLTNINIDNMSIYDQFDMLFDTILFVEKYNDKLLEPTQIAPSVIKDIYLRKEVTREIKPKVIKYKNDLGTLESKDIRMVNRMIEDIENKLRSKQVVTK